MPLKLPMVYLGLARTTTNAKGRMCYRARLHSEAALKAQSLQRHHNVAQAESILKRENQGCRRVGTPSMCRNREEDLLQART